MSTLAKAKYRLYQRAPYWSHLLQSLALIEHDKVPEELAAKGPEYALSYGAATPTAIHVFNENAKYLEDEEYVSFLAHELLHHVTDYFGRVGSRDRARYNLAQDLVINQTLLASGFKPFPGMQLPHAYGAKPNQSADQYYDWLQANQQEQQDGAACGTGAGGLGDEAGGEANDAQRAVQRAVRNFSKAVHQAKGQGLEALCEDLDEPLEGEAKVDWRDKLHQMVRMVCTTKDGSDAARYTHVSARQGGLGYADGSPRLPAWRQRRFDIAVALDTSGSMGGLLGALQAELEAICAAAGGTVRLIQCDADVGSDGKHRKGQKVKLTGGGGTDFTPVFDLIAKGKRPDCLVYATDGYGTFPAQAPNYPVVWGIVGDFTGVPFGTEVRIETGE